jgi:hypothetical protein
MEYFFQTFNTDDFNTSQDDFIASQLQKAKDVYFCFCNPHNPNQHHDSPRFIFTQCPCLDCEKKGIELGDDIHLPVFQVVLTEQVVDYIFDSTPDKEISELIPKKVFQAFKDCAVAYGNSDLDWSTIVDAYDDMHPENIFTASHLENYFLQLALLVTFPQLKDQ